VGKFALEIITNVIKPSLVKDHVAVVCSAISATVKADGTTNRWGFGVQHSGNEPV
jgi:aspartate kinase